MAKTTHTTCANTDIGGVPIDIVNGNLRVRTLTEEDFPIMLKWLTDDRVLEFYDGRDTHFTLETLKERYSERWETPYHRVIIEYEDVPIGYGQIFRLDAELYEEYQYTDNGETVYAADQFIGVPEYWNRGIGTLYMKTILDHLKTVENADAVVLDPHKDNERALHVYEKVGFRLLGQLPSHELHEGRKVDCVLLEYR